jgi:hypothetical protein
MNFISHENTLMRREAVRQYGGFNESKRYMVEYGLWLNLIKDHRPLVVDDQFTVFIIHSGSTSTGSLWRFSKAILRAFRTQRKEKVLPFVGYYPKTISIKNGSFFRNGCKPDAFPDWLMSYFEREKVGQLNK